MQIVLIMSKGPNLIQKNSIVKVNKLTDLIHERLSDES